VVKRASAFVWARRALKLRLSRRIHSGIGETVKPDLVDRRYVLPSATREREVSEDVEEDRR